MRILLTGKNGQLGRCFQDKLENIDHELFAFDSFELDISNPQQVSSIIDDINPDIIVNAAAYTAVDKAESEKELSYSVNENGPRLLALAAAKLNIPLIHISTDYVFDGDAVEPYTTHDTKNPQSVYGASKLAGEIAIQAVCSKYIIFRTAWVFSEYGNNFLLTMIRLANERDSLNVVADQYGCPTYAGDLAQAIVKLCDTYEQKKILDWGVYHYCGDMSTSWHGFSRTIFSKAYKKGLLNKKITLTAISSDLYPTKANRPKFSVLDCQSLDNLQLTKSCWIKATDHVINKLCDL